MRITARKLSQRDDGFTLVELVVAMFVIGMVLVALVGIQISAAVTISQSRARQEATALGNEAVEQMRAIPWNVLAKGMDKDYLTASGGDTRVTAGQLSLDGKNVTLIVATAAADQDSTKPWPPLFTSTGSNKQVRTDPSGQLTRYTIRGYVYQIPGATSALGIAALVEWPGKRGTTEHTTVWSTAYRGWGCGGTVALDTQPFLGACQAFFDSSATSGQITATLTATTIPDIDGNTLPLPLLGTLSASDIYSMSMRTAGVTAAAHSQQVTVVSAGPQYGGSAMDDNDEATQPDASGWVNGFEIFTLAASDDVSNPDIPPDPPNGAYLQDSSAEAERSISTSSPQMTLRAWSDYLRPATADASSLLSCQAGIPVKQPCARGNLNNLASINGGSGYILMEVDGTIFRLSRRLPNVAGEGTNVENAWAARFNTAAGTIAGVGCTTISGAGCVSAGAERTMASLSIGTVATGTTTWNTKAPNGLVIVKGRSGCTVATGLYESIMVQRGASQPTAVATAVRCGAIDYFTDTGATGYSTITFPTVTNGEYDTALVTWSNGNYTVTAQAHISVSPPTSTTSGPADCIADACVITADAGEISIDTIYTVSWPAGSYRLTMSTVISSPQATASYKKAPGA